MTVPPRRLTPALLQIDAILSRLRGPDALPEVCRFLRSEFDHYAWVGVYRLDGETLVLAGWAGDRPTEHTRIPLARGVCGQAARENRSVIVDDVRSAPEYLPCFLETRSEIVVPVRDPGTGRVLGEIDIDGSRVAAYDASDERFLSEVARKIASAVEESAPPAPLGLVRSDRAGAPPPP